MKGSDCMKNKCDIARIIKTKKSERTIIEQALLDDWFDKWFKTPIRIVIFPAALIVRLYKWTYYEE